MFQTRCTECGSTEKDHVVVSVERSNSITSSGDRTLSQNLTTAFECNHCSTTATVETGVHPTTHTDKFETVRVGRGDKLQLRIDGQDVEFTGIDEKLSEDAYYTSDGVRGTSRIQHVHVHAREPPTFSKGHHRVEVGDFVDEEMVLGRIRYHDSNHRTLKFYKVLDNSKEEPLAKLSPAQATSHQL